MKNTTQRREPPSLRDARLGRGMSLRKAAGAAGIDPTHLMRVERGEKHLSLAALYRLALVLGLTDLEHFIKPYVGKQGRTR